SSTEIAGYRLRSSSRYFPRAFSVGGFTSLLPAERPEVIGGRRQGCRPFGGVHEAPPSPEEHDESDRPTAARENRLEPIARQDSDAWCISSVHPSPASPR